MGCVGGVFHRGSQVGHTLGYFIFDQPYFEQYHVFNCEPVEFFTPQPLRAVGVFFSPMVSGWAGGRTSGQAGGRAAGNSLSGRYLRNRKV